MRNKLIAFLVLASMLLGTSSVFGQDPPGRDIYPFQYATRSAYEAATGNSIASYGEAPMLADRVTAGELPPVEDRLPVEPVVVSPLNEVGVYGGELVGPSLSPTCCGWDELEVRLQKLLTIDTDLASIIPNIAESYEISEDQTTYTIHLREGHKWSDGTPFTSEDFRFYFEDFASNAELSPVPPTPWAVDGELPVFEVIDETTVRYTYPEPYPALLIALGSEIGNSGFIPAHYFKQFHLDYNPDADALAQEQGYETWVQLFNARKTPYNMTWDLGAESDPYAPTLNTYVYVSTDSFGNKLYERNPYFFKVDIAGNQLPYIDTLRRVLVEDEDVQELKAVAGEFTHHGWAQLRSFPVYRENEEAGGYRMITAAYARGNEYALTFNFTHEDPVMREIFWDIRFRQAMSLAINRDEINELLYFGLATPSQAVPVPVSYYYQDWMTDYFAQYDPDEANRLLDEMGLDQRDADGFRLRPDGETLFINIQISAWEDLSELVTSYWNAVGVKTNLKMVSDGLIQELRANNSFDVGAWGWDVIDIGDVSNNLYNLRAPWGVRASGQPWRDWFDTEGANGEEPPQEIQELEALGDQFLALPYLSEEQLAIGQEFYTRGIENLYVIGTVQSPPQPILLKTNLMNTPGPDTEALWSWSYRQWVMFMPEQWYFAP